MRILYVSTEVHPQLKTGGLADVNAALPPALTRIGCEVRLLLPGFAQFVDALVEPEPVANLQQAFGPSRSLVRGKLNGIDTYLIIAPEFYFRAGNPYLGPDGRDWPDNHLRFALLGSTAARFADGSFDGWRPDIVHGHDWHAGLMPAYIAARGGAVPGTVFTIHNLSFQGLFPAETFSALQLPPHFFAVHGLEFYGKVSFMKAGLHYADRITTVSPSYAREIQKPAQGCGMEGLLRSRAGALTGILNGVDPQEWSPRNDRRIAATFGVGAMQGKAQCKAALRTQLGLAAGARGPIVGVVSRLTTQKGLDLLLGALPRLLAGGGQLALLGAGDPALEQAFRAAAAAHPGAVAVHIGYDEDLAHRIVAGADAIVVPSRFEPCGLTQMYGLAYGTLPLVRRVGGLADTVKDAGLPEGNGVVFDAASVSALEAAIDRLVALWRDAGRWSTLQSNAMRADFGWAPSAEHYLSLYRALRPNA